jgi:2-dehydropantoate 2-reductase
VARGTALDRARSHGMEYTVRKTPTGEGEEGVVSDVVLKPSEVNVQPTCAALKEKGDPADFVILCVKTWQVAQAAHEAAAILSPSGCIVTTQNGVSAPTDASAASCAACVVVGIAKVIAFREDPEDGPLRCVRLSAPSPRTVMLGEYGSTGGSCESERVLRLREILRTAGIDVPVPEDGNIKRELWRKATMMCCMGPMSAVTRADIYTMLNTPPTREMLLAAMEEVCDLSACFEDSYVGDGWAQKTMAYLENIKPGSTPSTVRDVVCGRPSEIREMSGALRRLGRQQVQSSAKLLLL